MGFRENGKDFKFVGKGATWLNSDSNKKAVKDACDYAGVDLKNGSNGYGRTFNVIVRKGAKKDRYGNYDELDVIGRFSDGEKCNTFLNGMYAATRLCNMKKRK